MNNIINVMLSSKIKSTNHYIPAFSKLNDLYSKIKKCKIGRYYRYFYRLTYRHIFTQNIFSYMQLLINPLKINTLNVNNCRYST